MLVQKFDYPKLERETDEDGVRHYVTPGGAIVPSVTTILKETKPEEDKAKLDAWKQRVGEAEAEKISTEASERGEAMHECLEEFCLTGNIKKKSREDMRPRQYMLAQQGSEMAEVIIKEGLQGKLDECWGVEVSMYYEGLYAGTTDLLGVFEKVEKIGDFKQTNKQKKRAWIDDYFLQVTAYGEAHNHTYGTNIKNGVILMCSQYGDFQQFDLDEWDYERYRTTWWDRVSQYYKV